VRATRSLVRIGPALRVQRRLDELGEQAERTDRHLGKGALQLERARVRVNAGQNMPPDAAIVVLSTTICARRRVGTTHRCVIPPQNRACQFRGTRLKQTTLHLWPLFWVCGFVGDRRDVPTSSSRARPFHPRFWVYSGAYVVLPH